MVILHKDLAADFEQFCRANPQPCPLLAVLPAGCRVPSDLAPSADIVTDLPKYRIYRQGRMTEEVRTIVTQHAFCMACFESPHTDAAFLGH